MKRVGAVTPGGGVPFLLSVTPREEAQADIERVVAQLRQTPANGKTAPDFAALMVEYRRLVQICRDEAPTAPAPAPSEKPERRPAARRPVAPPAR